MSDKISGKFNPIPSTIANQRWISICNIIIYLETKFRPNRRIFVFGCHFVPWLPWQRPPFWIFFKPQKLSHTTVDIPTKRIIIWLPNHGYQFPTSKFRPNRRIFVFWRPFWIKNGRHSKPMMNINSQHHNLLGSQISPKSEDFCILVAILYLGNHGNGRHFEFFQPPIAATHYSGYSYKDSWSLMKGIQIFFKSPLFCFHGNCGKVCPTDSDLFWPILIH